MSNSTRDPITTHVLDSTTGLPARHIPVALTLLSENEAVSSTKFTGHTSADGRISQWEPVPGTPTLPHRLPEIARLVGNGSEGRSNTEKLMWSLKFNTGAYWGAGKTFYPEVEVKFFVDVEEVLN
ncbi:hypothetical protein MMC18_006195, partial [Xylographa bjoerkii]|nr:hypothetical protein [Xylographa bjoerkii]